MKTPSKFRLVQIPPRNSSLARSWGRSHVRPEKAAVRARLHRTWDGAIGVDPARVRIKSATHLCDSGVTGSLNFSSYSKSLGTFRLFGSFSWQLWGINKCSRGRRSDTFRSLISAAAGLCVYTRWLPSRDCFFFPPPANEWTHCVVGSAPVSVHHGRSRSWLHNRRVWRLRHLSHAVLRPAQERLRGAEGTSLQDRRDVHFQDWKARPRQGNCPHPGEKLLSQPPTPSPNKVVRHHRFFPVIWW